MLPLWRCDGRWVSDLRLMNSCYLVSGQPVIRAGLASTGAAVLSAAGGGLGRHLGGAGLVWGAVAAVKSSRSR